MLKSFDYCFRATIDMQLVIDVLKMLFDRIDADRGFVSNHFIGITPNEPFEDFNFSSCQIERFLPLLRITKKLKNLLRYKWTHRRTALSQFLQRLDKF